MRRGILYVCITAVISGGLVYGQVGRVAHRPFNKLFQWRFPGKSHQSNAKALAATCTNDTVRYTVAKFPGGNISGVIMSYVLWGDRHGQFFPQSDVMSVKGVEFYLFAANQAAGGGSGLDSVKVGNQDTFVINVYAATLTQTGLSLGAHIGQDTLIYTWQASDTGEVISITAAVSPPANVPAGSGFFVEIIHLTAQAVAFAVNGSSANNTSSIYEGFSFAWNGTQYDLLPNVTALWGFQGNWQKDWMLSPIVDFNLTTNYTLPQDTISLGDTIRPNNQSSYAYSSFVYHPGVFAIRYGMSGGGWDVVKNLISKWYWDDANNSVTPIISTPDTSYFVYTQNSDANKWHNISLANRFVPWSSTDPNCPVLTADSLQGDSVFVRSQVSTVSPILSQAKIFPTPADASLYIVLNQNQSIEVNYTIITLEGKKVIQQQQQLAPYEVIEIHTANLAPGYYFLKLETPQGYLVRKFEVRH